MSVALNEGFAGGPPGIRICLPQCIHEHGKGRRRGRPHHIRPARRNPCVMPPADARGGVRQHLVGDDAVSGLSVPGQIAQDALIQPGRGADFPVFVRGHAQIKADIVQMAEGQHAVVFQIGQGSFHLSVRQPAAQAGGKDIIGRGGTASGAGRVDEAQQVHGAVHVLLIRHALPAAFQFVVQCGADIFGHVFPLQPFTPLLRGKTLIPRRAAEIQHGPHGSGVAAQHPPVQFPLDFPARPLPQGRVAQGVFQLFHAAERLLG